MNDYPLLCYRSWEVIVYNQRQWARSRGIKFGAYSRTHTLEENLFQPLNAETRTEFEARGEFELGSAGGPGNMQTLYSSSALVCNVFDYWRSQLLLGKSLAVLTNAFGAPASVKQMQFEQVYMNSLGGNPPLLNVVLRAEGLKPFLIKSNFTGAIQGYSSQSYQRYLNRTTFTESSLPTRSYYPNSGEVWGKYGLTRCEALARRINSNQDDFSVLNAPQLLNHILGLVKTFQKNFTLLYLWYDDCRTWEAAYHRAEVKTFRLRLNGEIDFRAMTYQELFEKIRIAPDVDEKYIAYLAERYFPETAAKKSG